MTGGFDEWAAARTPPLLALASAIVGDPDRADAVVTRTLSRIHATWDRVQRGDPDLEARRHLARACATPRRTAVVLRELEDRSDDEIAEILGCSASAVRRHLQRGLAEDGAADRPVSVREELVARAGSAPTQLLTRPVATADVRPPRRRRTGRLAALAVVLLVGGVAYVSHETRTPDGVITYPHVDVPRTWRTESYAGVQLQVPEAWGWGASPVTSDHFAGPRHLGACGTNQASVLSPDDDRTYVSVLSGFVGRPAITNERCVGWGADGSYPEGDAVWFDSPLAVGVRPVGPVVAETRQVGDQHVTVFSDDRDLRRQILGSAETVDVDDNGCPTQAVTRPAAGSGDSAAPTSLSVCVYSQDTGVTTLMWSGTVPGSGARAYTGAVEAAADDAATTCSTPSGRWAAVGVRSDDDVRWDLVDLGCRRIRLAGGASAPLTPDTVKAWAYGGATAYLSAPRGTRALDTFFIAPSG
ncbi:MAG TPA: sigma factor-like helix-turn-helix DNA-binding protein [Nocardioides sp.]|jgi:DNA-binding CsgD family transcriptional regulator|nr:sigma factor-like helix-turn-helix DNA-binding protein [Nocardioides sp.]